MNKKRFFRILLYVAFAAYIIMMIWLLYGQRLILPTKWAYKEEFWRNINLIPFRTIMESVEVLRSGENTYLIRHNIINLIGNVGVFIPLGYFLPKLFPKLKSFKKTLLVIVATVLIIELVQWITLLGSLDIDDVILNIPGALAGWLIYRKSNSTSEE
ncbi:MAG: VanZ family protein [Clostridia bacterium]|nr:VanZ family protein [Clostridia bacterium]